MTGSPGPAWFPFDTLWSGGLVVAGVALTPVWFRLGYRDGP